MCPSLSFNNYQLKVSFVSSVPYLRFLLLEYFEVDPKPHIISLGNTSKISKYLLRYNDVIINNSFLLNVLSMYKFPGMFHNFI